MVPTIIRIPPHHPSSAPPPSLVLPSFPFIALPLAGGLISGLAVNVMIRTKGWQGGQEFLQECGKSSDTKRQQICLPENLSPVFFFIFCSILRRGEVR